MIAYAGERDDPDCEVPGVGVLPLMYTPPHLVGEDRIPLKIAPRLREHNDEIFGGSLGHTDEELAELRAAGVISTRTRGLRRRRFAGPPVCAANCSWSRSR